MEEHINVEEEMKVKDFITKDGKWNVNKLKNYISSQVFREMTKIKHDG